MARGLAAGMGVLVCAALAATAAQVGCRKALTLNCSLAAASSGRPGSDAFPRLACSPRAGLVLASSAQGECVRNAIVCTSVGQSCNDPNTDVTGDCQCVCVPPQQGRKQGGPAVCTNGQTCFAAGVSGQGQPRRHVQEPGQLREDRVCAPNSVSHWTCNSVPPAIGSARGGLASCGLIGECVANAVTGDDKWQCQCVSPATGFGYGAAASCAVDEWANYEQRCVDPKHNFTSLNGWRCECTWGQRWAEPKNSLWSRDDWACQCVAPASGKAVRSPAVCVCTGECVQNAPTC
eukprot:TRINITY_DN21003_c0_g1_i1.p1 TRINITY_DN21003_c0_g1~~TRINITY_DN21003_c0_g1_i1.p1  ORF type:complete len:324 (+),score=51.11 TRINITY_DN21003_c0_g1_i1:100-972(+)